ncbi:MAG: FtsX-like permease family protein, partial [Blastocatellia bacterium]|nr:FtsX-like permease family protein [Blastocatellia bacterium]
SQPLHPKRRCRRRTPNMFSTAEKLSFCPARSISLLGGAAGLLVAVWVKDGLMALAPPDWTNFAPDPRLDARVLAFAFALAILTGAAFGLVPALRASGTDVGAALKEEGAIGSSHRSRFFSLFVIAQVSVSLVLLVVAGLLLRSLGESEAFNPGFDSDNILLATVDLDRHGYSEAQGKEFYRQLTERLRALPGVTSVTSANLVPLGGAREALGYRIAGHEPPPGRTTFSIDTALVGPDYFSTMGIPILRGRGFDDRDEGSGARPVTVINETMARRFWPGEDAIGKNFQIAEGPFVEIIGIARDIKYYSLGEEPRPYVYGFADQVYFSQMTIHLRTAGSPETLARAVKREVAALDANVAVLNLITLAELRRVPLFPVRALAAISTMFGMLALVLTAVGIYGMVSYSVSRRTREIGIRQALGADRSGIFRLIVGQGLVLTLIGIAVGLVACFALTRFLSSLLFDISATDPFTFGGTALLLAGVALMACYIPARRATKIDPMTALRYE